MEEQYIDSTATHDQENRLTAEQARQIVNSVLSRFGPAYSDRPEFKQARLKMLFDGSSDPAIKVENVENLFGEMSDTRYGRARRYLDNRTAQADGKSDAKRLVQAIARALSLRPAMLPLRELLPELEI